MPWTLDPGALLPIAAISVPPLLSLLTAAIVLTIALRRRRTSCSWPLCPWSVVRSLGGLVPWPVVPLMPHSRCELGLFNPFEG
jgi:hypothetical protein